MFASELDHGASWSRFSGRNSPANCSSFDGEKLVIANPGPPLNRAICEAINRAINFLQINDTRSAAKTDPRKHWRFHENRFFTADLVAFSRTSPTNRRLFEVVMYGGLAHANDDKRIEYERWMKGPAATFMQFFFEDIVAHMLQVIVSFQSMNERTIQMLESEEKNYANR